MRTHMSALILTTAMYLPGAALAGGLLGDLVQGVGKATGIAPLQRAGQEMDNAHRDIKNAIPPCGQIEAAGSDLVRRQFLNMCAAHFQVITNAVIARCSNYDGRLNDQDLMRNAIDSLVAAKMFSRSDFDGVQIR